MAITGYLAEFSLAEIFQLLDQGHKTGLLTIRSLLDTGIKPLKNHYIWFNQGRIVAAANGLNNQGLLHLISNRGWLGDRAASRLAQACSLETPMGLCLKSQGVLQTDQLKLLFYTQVMRQVCALFELKDGWFEFDSRAPLQSAEMTGLSAPATEVTLAGLRVLKDWTTLADKLPSLSSAIVSAVKGKPHLPLNQTEWQLWEFANGTTSLEAIATQLHMPTEKVQRVAFRLMVVGVLEEIPVVAEMPEMKIPSLEGESPAVSGSHESHEGSSLSQSFLKNLVGFLKGKS